jgi:hypothetical protein
MSNMPKMSEMQGSRPVLDLFDDGQSIESSSLFLLLRN